MDFSARPWSRIHVDFAGPISGQMYIMVVVDAYSKFPEVVKMINITAGTTITAYSAGMDRLKFLFLTMVPSSLRKNLKSFVLTMEFQQRTNIHQWSG